MSPRQRRAAAAACYEPLAYAGLVATVRRRAANDNRAAAGADRRRIAAACARLTPFLIAGAVALGGGAHMALRVLGG
ncbi:MAG TPA: hypothetical protein VHL98_04695 [Microvirga sp.]|jgi:hypothetical protein|nr:hypothetical protein [Microvirga sp.]